MISGLIIPADLSEPVELVRELRLSDLELLLGGLPSAVDLQQIDATLYVNDNALNEGMTFNARASFLWWLYRPDAYNLHRLVGTTVLLGLGVRGELATLGEAVTEQWLKADSYYVEIRRSDDESWLRATDGFPGYYGALNWAVTRRGLDPSVLEVRIERDTVPLSRGDEQGAG